MDLIDITTHVLSFRFVYLYAFGLLWLIRARDLPDAGLICTWMDLLWYIIPYYRRFILCHWSYAN
jgi:hypothetical protein